MKTKIFLYYLLIIYVKMKQKIFFAIAILSLLSLAVCVSGRIISNAELNEIVGIEDHGVYTIDVVKGWNLLTGFSYIDSLYWIEDSEIFQEDIVAVYYFFNKENQYKLFYTAENGQEKVYYLKREYPNLEPNFGWQMNSHAYWVYFDKPGKLKYVTQDQPPLNQRILFKGWNFVGITSEMKNLDLIDVLGDCQLENEKAYIWDAEKQEWERIGLHQYVDESSIGKGIVVKVTSDCTLGNGGMTPPGLPN